MWQAVSAHTEQFTRSTQIAHPPRLLAPFLVVAYIVFAPIPKLDEGYET